MRPAQYKLLTAINPKASRVRGRFSDKETTSESIYIAADVKGGHRTEAPGANGLSNEQTTSDSIHVAEELWKNCRTAECGHTEGSDRREEKDSLRWAGSKTVCNTKPHRQPIRHLTTQSSLSGLGGVPASLQHLREEVGLSGAAWESFGIAWQALGVLWVQAETALSRSGRTDLSFNEIRKASIPEEWKEWMNAKLMNIDAKRPADSFGKVFTDYLKSLPSTALKAGGTVEAEVWCRPGKTGVLGLLLCLYWQAEYAGIGNDWKGNLKLVEDILNAVLAEPDW